MKRHHSLFVGLLLLSVTNAQGQAVKNVPTFGTLPPHNAILPAHQAPKLAARDFSRLPLTFESNRGQTNAKVRFLSHTAESTLFLTPSEAVFSLNAPSRQKEKNSLRKDHKARRTAQKESRVALRMQMIGANSNAAALEQQPLAGRINYFIGQDRSKWHTGVPTFGRVGFQQVYPGVDIIYYGNQKHLEYDFMVAPHADPRQIQLRFAGAQQVQVNAMGDLSIRVKGQELRWQKPTVYQQDTTGKHSIEARFRLKRLPNGEAGVSFALGHYDTTRPLVIDPVLLYSTYLNVSNNSAPGTTCIALDGDGNVYLAGDVNNLDFPTTPDVVQPTRPGSAFVTKLNPTGTALVYSTYLGAGGELASGIAVDSGGNAYVVGDTQAVDFPTLPGSFQPHKGSLAPQIPSGFVTKLNPTGTAMVYSTYLGGVQQTYIRGIALDDSGNAYVCGLTNSFGFPTTPGAFQTVYKSKGNGNAFVTKLNPEGTAPVYSTYLGGTGPTANPVQGGDAGTGIAVDSLGNAYVTGYTTSADFPVTVGAFQTVNSGGVEGNAFVTKLNPAGSGLIYSTLLGGTAGGNFGSDIALDSTGSAYVTGITGARDFPTTPGAFQTTPPPIIRQNTAFVSKLDPTGASLIYSTYLGGSTGAQDRDTADTSGIAVDSLGNAYVVGRTGCTDFPITPGALQPVRKALTGYSAFLTELNHTGTALLYSTYLDGSGQANNNGESASAITLGGVGNVYLTGTTSSNDFPTTPGVLQPTATLTNGAAASFVTHLSTLKPLSPDFNADGHVDLLLHNPTTGAIASWFMQGRTKAGGAAFSLTPPTEYALVGVGDFSGDGSLTLVLQSRVTNQIAFWYTSGANHAAIPGGNFVNTIPASGWTVVGVGDFNGDGKSDLVFQNQTTNQIAIWFMNGYLYQGGVLLTAKPLAGWKAAGVGDFNADGLNDIVFQNQTTGQIALWYMKGTTYLDGMVLNNAPAAGWKVVGVGDYNGDGSADLLFQNPAGSLAALWYLSNGIFVGGDTLSAAVPSGFKIVGPR